jgi:hypothetical protein
LAAGGPAALREVACGKKKEKRNLFILFFSQATPHRKHKKYLKNKKINKNKNSILRA